MKPILALVSLSLVVVLGAAVAAQQQEIRIVTTTGPGGPLTENFAGSLKPMATGSGVIFGQVAEADSNRPVAGALVTLTIPGAQPIRVMADGQGRFGFRDLPPGRFNVSTSRPGWVDGAYGRTRPAGPTLPLALEDGEKVSGVTVPMWRYASITGQVVDELGDPIVGKPVHVLKRTIAGGRIRLIPGPQDTTDDRGTYRIGMLEPGEYLVVVPMQQNDMALDIPFAAAEVRRDVVVAARSVAAGGAGGAMMMFETAGPGTPAGMSEDGRPLSFPTVFYPNAVTASRATVITVTSGEERAATDFQLKPVTTSRVSGTMMGPEGPATNLQVTMTPAEADGPVSPLETLTGFTDGQGQFTIGGVQAGQYTLRALRMPRIAMTGGETTTFTQGGAVMVFRTVTASGMPPLPTEPTLWAEMTVSVGARDLTDLTVGLRPGIKVTGMVQFNGGAERPASDQLPSIGLNLEPADSRPGLVGGRGRIEPSGQFSTMGVPPGRYFLRVLGAPKGWTFHSAMVNGRDASVVPIELESSDVGGVMIAFTDRPSELSGVVTMEGGSPEAASVLVFPTDTTAWVGYGSSSRRFASARADKEGNYRVTNLPAGDYFAVAIPDKLATDWQNPAFLETLAGEAARVRIRDADKVTQNLKVSR